MSRALQISCVLLLVSMFLACKGDRLARKMPDGMSAYIYAYTSGTVSRSAPVRVIFSRAVVGQELVGKPVEGGILEIKPAVEGQAVWEDDHTIRFDATGQMPSNQSYLATVAVGSLFKDAKREHQEFEFDFHTREQYMTVEIEGVRAPNPDNYQQVQVYGVLRTSDVTNNEDVQKSLTARVDQSPLLLDWEHDADGMTHRFKVQTLERGERESLLTLNWNGEPTGTAQTGETVYKVAGKNDFRFVGAHMSEGEEQYVELTFSDPIDASQTLDGLIRISDYYSDYRFLVAGNSVRLYTNYRLSGEQTINIDAAVKNTKGKPLGVAYSDKLSFSGIRPEVSLLGRGVIMPVSEGLIFPFEAINLNYVDVEIFKIFNNNILQFLQSNDLDGDYSLHRVGRVVFQKRIALKDLNDKASTSVKTRYALDLNKLIKADLNAIYQVRIGFRKEYTNYTCGADPDDRSALQPFKEAVDSDGDMRSIFDVSYDEYDEEEYSYVHRDDPCYAAYYNSERFIRRNVVASDLGIIAKKGADNTMTVVVTDLKTTDVRPNVKINFFDYQNQLISTAVTNGQGVASVQLKRKPYVAIAKWGNQQGYLLVEDGKELQLSRFEVEGTAPQKGLKGFLYGERGVWRPGDSLYLDFVLEDKNGKLPEGHPVTLELRDPKGQLQQRVVCTKPVRNVYPFHVATSDNAPTGTWQADVKAGGATFSKPLKIEMVKPNRLKIRVDLGKKALAAADKNLKGNLEVAWLHGAPGRNLKARIELQLAKMKTEFKNYKNFVFDDFGATFSAEPQVVFDAATDGGGHAAFNTNMQVAKSPGKLRANFRCRAFEAGGDFSSDFFSMEFSPYTSYAGVSLPTTRSGEKRIDVRKSANFNVASVSEDGKPIAGRNLMVTVYRVDWRWWWELDEGSESDYSNNSSLTAIINQTVKTDAKGIANVKLEAPQWGRYYVRVNDPESGHACGDFFYSGYPWDESDEGENDMKRSEAAMLAFRSDKETYNVGETVKLYVPTNHAGRVLVSLENGTKVVETFWAKTVAGDNTITFKVKPEMAPTIYANVSLIQPHAQAKNDLPIRMYGVIPIKVEDPKSHLTPVINMPDEVEPDKKFAVQVSEKTGRGMTYTIAIVDDGLLDLTRFQTPNPHNKFFAKEALGVATFDLYDQVLGAHGGELERILNIGGDGSGKAKNAVKANRFKPTVQHFGPFYLAPGKKVTHNLTIPNYIGSVRTMVVASGDGAYGNAEKTVVVRKPLMVLTTLPRVLGVGENFSIPVDVFALDGKIKNVTVTVKETTGLFKFAGSTTKNISFTSPGDQIVNFDMTSAGKSGVAKFTVTATGSGITATETLEIEVRNPNPYVSTTTGQVVDAGGTYNATYTLPGAAGTNKVTLEVSTIPPMNLAERLRYLIQYPHGCIEQTTSGAFPQLYVDQLIEVSPERRKEITANVNAAINRIKSFQTNAGGFGYWPGDNGVSLWGTNYAGHFLLEAQTAGYAVPANLLDRWKAYQQAMARRWDPALDAGDGFQTGDSELNQAYRLYTLALAKAPENGAMNQLRERKNLSLAAKWRLAAAYAAAGKPEIAKQIVNKVATAVPQYRQFSYTYGSDTRDIAMIADALNLMGDKTRAFQLLQDLSARMSSDGWYSTQEVAYTLLATCKIAGGKTGGPAFAYRDGKGAEKSVSGKSGKIIQIPLSTSGTCAVRNSGKAPLYVRVVATGQPEAGQEIASASNLVVNIAYKDLKGQPVNPAKLKQGTDFIAEVSINNPGTYGQAYKEMALTQIFASGWEILNSRMDKVQGYSGTATPEYQDIRDDRVYTYFDIAPNTTQVYRIQLNAAYAGRYYLPALTCSAMYNNDISATLKGQWVEIYNEGGAPVAGQ